MTAALRTDLPTWTVDTLDVSAFLRTDELGREWGVRAGSDAGWVAPPAPRTVREDRPHSHGSFRGVAFRDYRQFTLGGFVACPDAVTRERTELELSALCSDPGRLYQFRRRGASFDQTAMVELDEAPKIEMVTLYRLDWQFTFAAPDPRKHDFSWQQPVSTLPSDSTGGADFSASGLDFSGSGIDWGTGAAPAPARVGNYGSAPAYPVFTLTGPLDQPVVTAVGSGSSIYYGGSVSSNETVTINCDGFGQLGVPGHGCVSSTRGNVRSLLSIGDEWPRLEPGMTEGFQLQGSGGGSPTLQVSVRSAWW